MGKLSVTFMGKDVAEETEISLRNLVIAGWTGRDAAALEAHIAELEAIGVARPSTVPLFYRVSASLLTTAGSIEVLGVDSSGEVEPVVVMTDGEMWVGVGSDHTDRVAEASGVALSKQLCPKPLSRVLWRFADVADHWDDLILRCYAIDGDDRRLYQEGTTARMRRPEALIALYCGAPVDLPAETAMFCGTLPVIGEIRPAGAFALELEDPVIGRVIEHRYDVRPLPVVS